MDVQSILDQLLASGKSLWTEGKQLAQRQAGVPQEGPSRDAMLSGLGKGAAAGGLLALLLGTRSGRRLTGKIVTYGGLAALGTLAWRTYQDWQKHHPDATTGPSGSPLSEASGAEARMRSERLLRAMIMACRADGQMDAEERGRLQSQIQSLGIDADTQSVILGQIEAPLDIGALTSQVTSMAEATEIYLASRAVIDVDQESERSFLHQLATGLKLPAPLVEQLEHAATRG